MAYTVSPNMNLLVPIVGQELGPTYALDINTNLQTLIDQHDHSPGRGVQITPSGLNISSDLSIGGNSLTFIKSGQFVAQSSSLSTTNSIYSVNGNLYWTGLSTPVQITNGASIVGSGGTITGLPSGTAGASYASGTFTWKASSTTAASMDSGPLVIRTTSAGSGAVTLQPSAGFTGSYPLYLPVSTPSVQSFMTLDNAGNITAPWTVDNSTLAISSNQVIVKSGGITTTQIAANTVANSNLAVMPANTIKGNNTGSAATPIDLTPAQVSAMLSISGVPNVTIWGAGTYTFTVPASRIKVTLTAGGGGSGGAGPGNSKVGGGGGGGTVFGYISGLTVGSTVTVVVGAGGAGGNSSQGGTGGTSSFGSFMGAYGGTGGGYASTQAGGGTGGGAYISDPSVYGFGTNGSNGFPQSNTYTYIAYGGASYWGGGSSYIGASIFQGAIGGGGAAQNGTSPGGSGSDGIAIIEW